MPQARKNQDEQQDNAGTGAPQGFVEGLLEKGWQLRETYDTYLAQRKANRTMLRSLADQGMLTDEQTAELADLYPARESNRSDDTPATDAPDAEPTTAPATA